MLKQRPPKFDAELIAELVIRIITTTNSKRSRNNLHDTNSSSNDTVEPTSNRVAELNTERNVSVPQLSQHSSATLKNTTKGGNNRLAHLQRTAAKIRSEATAGISPTATTSTTLSANLNPNTTDTTSTSTINIDPTDKPSTTTTTPANNNTASEESGDAILVFLSGIQSIEKVNKALRQRGILPSLKAQVHSYHVFGFFVCKTRTQLHNLLALFK